MDGKNPSADSQANNSSKNQESETKMQEKTEKLDNAGQRTSLLTSMSKICYHKPRGPVTELWLIIEKNVLKKKNLLFNSW